MSWVPTENNFESLGLPEKLWESSVGTPNTRNYGVPDEAIDLTSYMSRVCDDLEHVLARCNI